jgi:hypothetical protein
MRFVSNGTLWFTAIMRQFFHCRSSVSGDHHHNHIGGTPGLLQRWPEAAVIASGADQTRIPLQTLAVQGGDQLELALANAPTFNPNIRLKTFEEARRNRVITDAYEPGSVFKLVAYAGALEEGLTRPDEQINCQGGTITVGKHVYHDYASFSAF